MAEIPAIVRSRLARSAEAKLRYEASLDPNTIAWQAMTESALGWWLFKRQPPSANFTYSQYRTIARQVIRNARDAATMQANPGLTILSLGRAPGISEAAPQFEYRSVVVFKDSAGNELSSTMVVTVSSEELSAEEVYADVATQVSNFTPIRGSPPYDRDQSASYSSFQIFIVSAGRR